MPVLQSHAGTNANAIHSLELMNTHAIVILKVKSSLEFSKECTTKNCYMDKNYAKTLIKINRDVEKFLDYPY